MSTAKVVVTSAKLSIEDVCAVAVLGAKVAADIPEPVASQWDSAVDASAPIETRLASLPLLSDASGAHRVDTTRAMLVVLLHRLLRLKPTAAVTQHAHFLTALLNQNVLPLVASGVEDIAALTLLAACQGRGLARVAGGDATAAAVALRSVAGLPLPAAPLGSLEKQLAAQAPLQLLAVSALAIGGARGVVPIADAVAALSCEAVEANAAPFAAEFVDASRPHRGIVTAAAHLRLMLESSKFVNARKESVLDPECIRYIPQVHGPARDTVAAAFKALELELNAAIATDAATVSAVGDVHPQALKTALKPVLDALQLLLRGSNERRAVMGEEERATPIKPATQCAILLVETVVAALVAETQSAFAVFAREEEVLKAKLAEKQAKAQEAAAKAAAAQAKEDEKLASMTEAQRHKVLEKRQKKLDKVKDKESAKKGAKEALPLGAGSTALRQRLLALGDAWPASVNAFDLRAATGQSTPLYLEELFEKLSSGGTRRKPKLAKGAQDFLPHQMQLREKIFNKVRTVFKRHAGVEIETPVFEPKETLTGKYGEDSKLIYDLADQGGELLALRYDLTVPFARFMALHNPGNIKRFHIAHVYRRDNPQMARGRFREFYQCDFDIAGTYAPMLPDAEVLSIGIEVLQQFPELGSFKVKLSHRLLLDAVLAICGVPADKFRTTCSAIDKLDKAPWADVRAEMVDDKGIPPPVADRIERFVCRVGAPRELHAQLQQEQLFGDNQQAKQAMDELALLFGYLDAMGVLDVVSFDLSLARGLDYYTGLIYEFVLTSEEHNVGSIAAGGRYDNLVGMFSATGAQIPCVGVSMGIERIFGILQAHAEKASGGAKVAPPQVLVASTGGALTLPRLQLCKELWRANVAAEIMQLEAPKFTKQLHYALEAGIPFMVVVGEDELAKGEVKIKDMRSKDEVTVARADMVAELLRRRCPTTDTLSLIYFYRASDLSESDVPGERFLMPPPAKTAVAKKTPAAGKPRTTAATTTTTSKTELTTRPVAVTTTVAAGCPALDAMERKARELCDDTRRSYEALLLRQEDHHERQLQVLQSKLKDAVAASISLQEHRQLVAELARGHERDVAALAKTHDDEAARLRMRSKQLVNEQLLRQSRTHQQEKEALLDRMTQLEMECNDAQRQAREMEIVALNGQTELESIEQAKQVVEAKLLSLKALSAKHDKLAGKVKQERAAHAAEREQWQRRLYEIKDTNAALDKRVSVLETENTHLRGLVASQSEELASAKSALAARDAQVADLQRALAEATAKETIRAEFWEREVSAHESQRGEWRQEKERLHSADAESKRRIAELEQQNVALMAQRQTMATEMGMFKAERQQTEDALVERMRVARAKYARVKQQAAALSAKNAELQEEERVNQLLFSGASSSKRRH